MTIAKQSAILVVDLHEAYDDEMKGGIMRKTFLCLFSLLCFGTLAAQAGVFQSVELGFHITPDVEVYGDRRGWDLSLSFGTTLAVSESGQLELLALLDSRLTTLGASVEYLHALPEPFSAGVGLTVLWPFASETRLLLPVIGSYITATAESDSEVRGFAEISSSLVTVGKRSDGWDILPPTELPTISFGLGTNVAEDIGIRGLVTLQPVIVDTTQLIDPIGRISNRLLIIPTFSTVIENRL